VVDAAVQATRKYGLGCTGSRFLSGNLIIHEQLEEALADYIGKDAALLFSTGYFANQGALTCLFEDGDYILCDKENHASLIDGCRMSAAKIIPFAHNSPESLRRRLTRLPREAGKMVVHIEDAHLPDLLEKLDLAMTPIAQTRGVILEFPQDARLASLPLRTDPTKLMQVLMNLVSNAIKFSPEGGVVRLVAALGTREGKPAVRLSVVDQGPGIPADMQQAVFEKFRQVDASHTKRHGGTGLGLAICRELAHMLGAGVGLHSVAGKGSTFWVEVPVQFAARALQPLMSGRAD
jgi:K+-sensing histidine kinase KdpD